MLEEKKIVDKLEIIGNIIEVRERISILKDGVEIAASFNRYSLNIDSDRSNLEPQVKKIADALWS